MSIDRIAEQRTCSASEQGRTNAFGAPGDLLPNPPKIITILFLGKQIVFVKQLDSCISTHFAMSPVAILPM